jgi:hypothetical protein
VFHVGQNEFLMLLFVLQSELDQRVELGRSLVGQQCKHRPVYMIAIREHLVQTWTREHPAFLSGVSVADRVVIRIEQNSIGRIDRLVAGLMRRKREGFEEPGRVRQMPLHRLASGIDWIAQSSAERGAARARVTWRTETKRSLRLPPGSGLRGDVIGSGVKSTDTSVRVPHAHDRF